MEYLLQWQSFTYIWTIIIYRVRAVLYESLEEVHYSYIRRPNEIATISHVRISNLQETTPSKADGIANAKRPVPSIEILYIRLCKRHAISRQKYKPYPWDL